MFDRTKFTRVVNDTGLTKEEVAQLYGVTRPTVYDWLEAGEPKQKFLARYVEKASTALLVALDKGLLPLPRNLAKIERKTRIESMAKTLSDLK